MSQTQGRRRTKNDPFLNMGFKHGKSVWTKNGAKCNMGFGRKTKNTPASAACHSLSSHGVPSHPNEQCCRNSGLEPVLVEIPSTWRSALVPCSTRYCVAPSSSLIGGKRKYLPIRTATDNKSLYDCVAKEAGVPNDKNTALTVAFLRERCSAGVGRMKTIVGFCGYSRDTNWPGVTKLGASTFFREALRDSRDPSVPLWHHDRRQPSRMRSTTL